jgi:hypothetical protein
MGRARVVAGAAALLLVVPLTSAAQGLGDASKKEKARREQAKPAKARTYTQEDLAALPPVANEPASSPDDSAASAAASTPGSRGVGGATPPAATGEPIFQEDTSRDAETSARRSDESLWRGRVAQARARVDRARQAHQTLAGLNLVPGYEYQDEKGRTVIGSVEQLQRMTAAAKAELDAAEKALADLLEEARRANVPPGWLR